MHHTNICIFSSCINNYCENEIKINIWYTEKPRIIKTSEYLYFFNSKNASEYGLEESHKKLYFKELYNIMSNWNHS